MKKYAGHIDWYILLTVLGMMLFSIAFVYSASSSYAELKWDDPDKLFWNHSIRIFIGIFLMFIFSRVDYHFWKKVSKYLLIVSIIFLILVFIIGIPINNTYRWVNLGGFNFQPSELAKLGLILHLCTLITERQEVIKSFKYSLFPMLFWSFIVCALIAVQPNFSTAFVIYLLSISIMFIGNTNFLHLLILGGISLAGGLIYASSAAYRLERLLVFFNPDEASALTEKATYQVNQAILAFGNGGVLGVGPGQSRQSHFFLPESYGDFIFSIIGEEYGFLGVFIIISAYILILWRGFLIAKKAPDSYGYYLAIGIILTFTLYAFISAGVNSGLLPTTGLPMPFISYGGSAVIFYASFMGILLNISAQAGVFPRKV